MPHASCAPAARHSCSEVPSNSVSHCGWGASGLTAAGFVAGTGSGCVVGCVTCAGLPAVSSAQTIEAETTA
jgi:hypothetical protein